MTVTFIPKFDLFLSGSGTTSTKDDWFDIMTGYSPIASGKRLCIGIVTFGSDDKSLTFELRANNIGSSTGTTGTTTLLNITTVPSGDSKDVDMDFFGNIQTLAPITAVSTGVEKLWLRTRSGTNTAGTFYYIFYFTEY